MARKDKFKRKCVACGVFKEKEELFRVTLNSCSGEIVLNTLSLPLGRSVYICKNNICVEDAFKRQKINKFLRANVPVEIMEKINAVLAK